jgi:hypothetical protein
MLDKTLLTAQDASINLVTAGVDLGNITNYSFAAAFSSGTLAGTFKLQVSNDGTNYVDLSGATDTIAAGAYSVINVSEAGYRYVRASWTNTGGSGNITVTFIGKELRFY